MPRMAAGRPARDDLPGFYEQAISPLTA